MVVATSQATRIGGPLLGHRLPYSKHQKKHDLNSWQTLVPILYTSPSEEQFVLLPNTHFISVLAYATGKKVASLVPKTAADKEYVRIESVVLAKYPKKAKSIEQVLADEGEDDVDEYVLFVGCQDGAIREFALVDLTSSSSANGTISKGRSCGDFILTGKCCTPRRVIMLSALNGIKFMTAPKVEMPDGVLLYSLIETKSTDDAVKQKLCRVVVPPFEPKKKKLSLADPLELIEKVNGSISSDDKKGGYENTTPFRLLSVANEVKRLYGPMNDQEHDVFVVIARSTGFKIYHERISAGISVRSARVDFHVPTPLSAITISPNGMDIACGHMRGDMRILTDVFPSIVHYNEELKQANEPRHPSHNILVRNVHWHAHPVTTLCYQQSEGVDPLLYSGGDESVLVIWQLARGTYKHADTLPRLAKGGITHVLTTGSVSTTGIVIFCEDNTLQLIQAHNRKKIWKIHGMAQCTEHTVLRNDQNSILMSGLADAPGYLHWLNPRSQCVETQLEVAPYNRVSRTEENDAPMPQPTVTHAAFCEDATQMLTVETVPTENFSVGKKQALKKGSKIGVVSSVKFWARAPKSSAERYFVTASMTFPHGERNRVAAVAMSSDGQYACTVSNDEKAFRMWRQSLEVDEEDKSRRRPVWICQYKVSTPSGYANFDTPLHGVKFSSDGTTLCIVYGYMMTLWDHRDATLLNSLRHMNKELIREIAFVSTDLVHDSILSRSKTAVKLQSPYGHKSKSGWSTGVPTDGSAILTQAQTINGEQVAISIYFPANRKTKIVYVSASTGEPTSRKIVMDVPFRVQSMILAGPRFQRKQGFVNAREDPVTQEDPTGRLFVMSINGDLFLVQGTDDDFSLDGSSSNKKKNNVSALDKKTTVPKIHMPPNNRKRDTEVEEGDGEVEPPAKRAAIVSFLGEEDSTPIATSELPLLSGNFMRAFVGRNLSKRQERE